MTNEAWHEEEPLLDGAELPEGALDRPVSSARFREALLERSTAVLNRRRRRGRALSAAGWLLAYAAGLATAYVALGPQQGGPPGTPSLAHQAAPPVKKSADDAWAELPPWELEQRSLRDEAHRSELLRLAGDRYLKDYADVASALRCYRQLLDLVPPAKQALEPEDNWLLVSLKQARLSEAPHENSET
jgi:hypothetical protein